MRFVLILVLAALAATPSFAANPDKILDAQELTALAAKAERATPKDQCYLDAMLVQSMSELAGQQMDNGETAQASASLKAIQEYTTKIHTGMSNNSKRLKDAQIMMRRTAFRIKELMMNASLNDQAAYQSTLNQLDQVQSQMMLAVFQK
ncbi:MAG: hypothetical protein WA634_13780 [Silvibacterium sp.]